MLRNFLFKSLLKSKLKGLPQDQQDKILLLVEKNPDFFTKIANEIEEMVKSGEGQENASLKVMQKYQTEIQQLMK